MVRSAIQPTATSQVFAMKWIDHYWDAFADFTPNEYQAHISMPTKLDVWQEYVNDMKKISSTPTVSNERFNELWNALFPQYLMRPWINIPGKCETCYEIDQLRKNSTSKQQKIALTQCHLLHRGGLFMKERVSYKERVLYALQHPDTVFSCITDGMDQNHSRMPYLGQEKPFKAPLTQHIQGILVHGYNNSK